MIHFVEPLVLDGQQVEDIGFSNMINRSQRWHKDLLRGKYAAYLNGVDIWDPECPGVYKLLMYSAGAAWRILRGSHQVPLVAGERMMMPSRAITPMSSTSFKAGDVVVMDIRTSHERPNGRGLLVRRLWWQFPILLSRALGVDGGPTDRCHGIRQCASSSMPPARVPL